MVAALVTLVFVLSAAKAHVRWQCPEPRSQNDAIKQGPCGRLARDTLDPDGIRSPDAPVVTLSPGPLTVRFEETIPHLGSPVRIALSEEGVDNYENCILLNHLPHYDGSRSGNVYSITIDIPDVRCNNCALQLIQVMTDKIRVPECTYSVELSARFDPAVPDNCFSNYHSCANVRINGSTPRSQFTCSQPNDWPFRNMPDFVYAQNEAASYDPPQNGSQLIGGLLVPGAERFNQQAGMCMNTANPDDTVAQPRPGQTTRGQTPLPRMRGTGMQANTEGSGAATVGIYSAFAVTGGYALISLLFTEHM